MKTLNIDNTSYILEIMILLKILQAKTGTPASKIQ
jgi:hypothetical protein